MKIYLSFGRALYAISSTRYAFASFSSVASPAGIQEYALSYFQQRRDKLIFCYRNQNN